MDARFKKILKNLALILVPLVLPVLVFAQSAAPGSNNLALPGMSINFGQGVDLVDSIEVLMLFTIITLAPSILILCTSFTRILIVLSFMRQAIGTQNMPPNQLLVGFSLFLSLFVMQPTVAIDEIVLGLRAFMQRQVRKADIGLFYDVTGKTAPGTIDDVPIHYLIPAFIISELKTSFQIGFLLYIPFLILDMVVASVLMAMGMMMLPPVVVSLPFKLLLFVLVDGWQLVTGSILRSFN
jgi:flagellar biosynthetic protein FliP